MAQLAHFKLHLHPPPCNPYKNIDIWTWRLPASLSQRIDGWDVLVRIFYSRGVDLSLYLLVQMPLITCSPSIILRRMSPLMFTLYPQCLGRTMRKESVQNILAAKLDV